MTPVTAIRIAPEDNVATLLADAAAGDSVAVDGGRIVAANAIPRGHKIATAALAQGDAVTKYGFPIGRASVAIEAGDHVHSHNLATALTAATAPLPMFAQTDSRSVRGADRAFRGYRRADGRVGTRNEIWIIPTVGCVGNLAERVARIAATKHAGSVDGIHAFKHPFGCSQLGDDLSHTRALLAGLAQHPNAGGVLIVGLGCENNQLGALIESIPAARRTHIRSLAAQSVEDDEAACLSLIEELVGIAGRAERSEAPLSELVLGVKCGGSDGMSGLTANPLVGRTGDSIAASGGRVILTEIPEIFGAEPMLLSRAASRDVFDRAVALIDDFKAYFVRHGEPVSENPSPGNVAGGITTLEEKSLGAVQKGGKVPLTDVQRYGGQATRPRPDPARSARQRCRVVDSIDRGRCDADPVHNGPRNAARLSRPDAQDRIQHRPRRPKERLDRLRCRPGARRRLRWRRRRAARSGDRDGIGTPNAVGSQWRTRYRDLEIGRYALGSAQRREAEIPETRLPRPRCVQPRAQHQKTATDIVVIT